MIAAEKHFLALFVSCFFLYPSSRTSNLFFADLGGVHRRDDAEHPATGSSYQSTRGQKVRSVHADRDEHPTENERRYQRHHRPLSTDLVDHERHHRHPNCRAQRKNRRDHVRREHVEIMLIFQDFDARRAPTDAGAQGESAHARCEKFTLCIFHRRSFSPDAFLFWRFAASRWHRQHVHSSREIIWSRSEFDKTTLRTEISIISTISEV